MTKTLLLADDSVTVRKVVELTFADEPLAVVTVATGQEAIDRLRREPPSIVLADVGMPAPNGYDIAEFVHRTPALAAIPVLLLAGALERVDDARVSGAGCAGVLTKPFEPQEVIGEVRRLLAGGGAPGGVAAADRPGADSPAPTAAATDDYLARLDQAFEQMHATRSAGAVASGASPEVPAPPPSQTVAEPTVGDDGPVPPAPTLADLFHALLAMEQGASRDAYPLLDDPLRSDAFVERVARRVAEQLGDRLVREMAAEIVSRTAERLVREEIERLKASVE